MNASPTLIDAAQKYAPSGSCTFDPSSTAKSPYQYRYPNGSIITSGRLYGDVCVYETGTCSMPTHALKFTNGSSFKCCEMTENIDANSQVWIYPLIGFWVPYVIFLVIRKKILKKRWVMQTLS